jgi:hypothetical protein
MQPLTKTTGGIDELMQPLTKTTCGIDELMQPLTKTTGGIDELMQPLTNTTGGIDELMQPLTNTTGGIDEMIKLSERRLLINDYFEVLCQKILLQTVRTYVRTVKNINYSHVRKSQCSLQSNDMVYDTI